MANSFLFVDWVTAEALRILVNQLKVAGYMNTDYNKEYTKEFAVGETVRVPYPQRFKTREGIAYDPVGIDERHTTVTVNQVFGVDFQYDSVEQALKMGRGMDYVKERLLKPAMATIANSIDRRAALFAYQNTNNIVGQLGVDPTSSTTVMQARQRMIELACPPGEKAMIITPEINTSLVPSLASLFNPQANISKQFVDGYLSRMNGFDWFEDVNIYNHTAGTAVTALTVTGAGQSGSAISVTGTAGQTLKKGDVISFDGVRQVNPQSRAVVGQVDKQFVITQDITLTAGPDTINIQPAIEGPAAYPGGLYQNVDALPASGAAVTLFPGTVAPSGKSGSQNLALHRDAFALVGVKMANPTAVEMASQQRDPETGISVAFVRQFDAVQRRMINRFDTLMGLGVLYGDSCAVRMLGA
jgi:hypothetical protein